MNQKQLEVVLMCRPTHYKVEYIINPWMKPDSVNASNALKQWERLVAEYKKAGIFVEVIEQESHLPDMVFAADQGIVKDKTVHLSNFRHPERQGEREPYIKWFEQNGYKVQFISEGYFFEGTGESLFWKDKLFVGTGFRTTIAATEKLGEALEIDSIALHLIDPRFYHLDTCFFPLDSDTVFFYPSAFRNDSVDYLKKIIPNLIPFTDDEALGFAANNVVSGDTVFTQDGNVTFVKKLHDLGYKTVELDMSEYVKAGGGIHCLTNVLE